MNWKKPEFVFFDTNVYINLLRSPEYIQKTEPFLQGAYLHVLNKIVLMELWAGAKTKVEENILLQYQKTLPLMPFSDNLFITAGQVMRQMVIEYKLEPQTRRRLTWDILIALSAQANNALLLTENGSDFSKIRKFIEFEFYVFSKP